MEMKLTAVFKKVPEGYIGFVEELPGANTQGDTLEEARMNLREAVEMVLEANKQLAEESIQAEEVIREPLIINAGGKPITSIGPVREANASKTLKELKGVLGELPRMGDELDLFEKDLIEVRKDQPSLPEKEPWE